MKIRFCLTYKSAVKNFVASKCPVCPPPQVPQKATVGSQDSNDVLAEINKKLDLLTTMNGKITTLMETVSNIQKNYTYLEGRVTKLESGSVDIASTSGSELVKQVAERLSVAAKVTVDLNAEIRQLQMESRLLSDQFVISGLAEQAPENLVHVAVRLGSMIGVENLVDDQIQYAEGIGNKQGSTRDILVKCNSPSLVNRIFLAKKNFKALTANVIFPELNNVPIYVNRRYPSALYKLRQLIIKKYPAIDRRNVWIASTCICARLKDKSEPIKVYPSTDLESF